MGKGLPVSDSHTAMNNCYTLCLIKHFDIFFIMILSIYSFFFFFLQPTAFKVLSIESYLFWQAEFLI